MAYSAHQPTARPYAELRAFFDRCRAEAAGDVLKFAVLVSDLHDNMRSSGARYKDHLEEVDERTTRALKASRYYQAVRAAANMHDLHEDIEGPVILDPKEYKARIDLGRGFDDYSGKIILNEELLFFGRDGAYTAYLVYKLTKPEHRDKLDYLADVTGITDDRELKLRLLALLVKVADRDSNTKKDESFFYRGSAATMLEIAMDSPINERMDIVLDFLRGTNVSSWFYNRDHKFIFHRLFENAEEREAFERRFITAMSCQFELDKQARADENLIYFLPRAERGLLVFPGLDGNNRFDIERAKSVDIYDYDEARKMLRECYIESILILEGINLADHPVFKAQKALAARDVRRTKGYSSILSEVSHEFDIIGYRERHGHIS